MAENLNYNASGSKCYDNDSANCEKYGRLYKWATAKKACPSGWHLPSKSEYETLDRAVGGEKVAGKKLKAKSGWNNNGDGGYWWSASESSSDYAYYRLMGYNYEGAYWDNYNGSILFSVRCLQD